MLGPNLNNFHQGVPEISHSQGWDEQTSRKHDASSHGCHQHGGITTFSTGSDELKR